MAIIASKASMAFKASKALTAPMAKAIVALRISLRNSTVRGGSAFLLGGIIAHIFYYVYRIAMGRLLSPADFGEVTVFLSAMFILMVPAAPLQTIAAKTASELFADKNIGALRDFGIKITLAAAGIGGVVLGGMALLANPLAGFLHLSSPATIYTLFAAVLCILLFAILRGILQGMERFANLAMVVSLESLARFGFGIVFVLLGFRVAGALAGVLIALVAAYALAFWHVRGVWQNKSQDTFVFSKPMFTNAVFILLAFFALQLLLNVDVLLVKHYFSPQEAGVFSAFATLGKGTALFGMLFAAVLFPVIVRRKKQQKNVWQPFWPGLGAVALLSLSAAFVLFLFGRFFLLFLLGEQYSEAASYVGMYAFIMAGVGCLFYASNFFMALGKFGFLYILFAGSILEISLIIAWHEHFTAVLYAMAMGTAFTLAAFAVYTAYHLHKKSFPQA